MHDDPLIADAIATRRHRMIIVAFAVAGILAGVVLGTLAALGWFGGGGGPRSPAMVMFYAVPFAVCFGLGHLVHAVVRWHYHRL
jgi:fatty acid desaturase